MPGKVVFFVTSLQSGGLENYLLRFLKETYQKFDQICVFCKSGKAGQLESLYESIPNVEIITQKIGFYDPLSFVKLYQYLRANKFDAVCDFTGNFAGQVLMISKYARIKKRIVFYRGASDRFNSNILKRGFNNHVKNLVLKYATDILSNSKAAFEYFFKNQWQESERFEVIYNGINAVDFRSENNNLRTELKIPENAFVVGHTGRYNSAKNHKTILRVAEELVSENNNFYFILCGNQVKNALENIVNKKQLNEKIMLFENREDIPKFLNTMDCYYFPSITEGQPNALIEAMVMGLPIVASNIEPIRETVPEQAFDYLVPPLDILKAKENILKIFNEENPQTYETWAVEKYNSSRLFLKFLNRFK